MQRIFIKLLKKYIVTDLKLDKIVTHTKAIVAIMYNTKHFTTCMTAFIAFENERITTNE